MISIFVLVLLAAIIIAIPVSIYYWTELDRVEQEIDVQRAAILDRIDGGGEFVTQLDVSERLELLKQKGTTEQYAEAKVKSNRISQESDRPIILGRAMMSMMIAVCGGILFVIIGMNHMIDEIGNWRRARRMNSR